MSSIYESKDVKLIDRLKNALEQKAQNTAELNNGCMHFSSDPLLTDNRPSVFLSKKELKTITGRSYIRESVLNTYENRLTKEGLDVSRTRDGLKITCPVYDNENLSFRSLSALEESNKEDQAQIKEDEESENN